MKVDHITKLVVLTSMTTALVIEAVLMARGWPAILPLTIATLATARLSVTGLPGVAPRSAILWIMNVTLVLGTGILWFDWLYANFVGHERRFRIVVVGALAASWLATTSVAVYQLLFDVTFLNRGLFGFLQRASGMMLDANPFGVIAAIGIPSVAAAALLTPWKGRSATVLAVTGLGWGALWASGSRTALAAGIVGTAFVLYYWADSVWRCGGTGRWVWSRSGLVLSAV